MAAAVSLSWQALFSDGAYYRRATRTLTQMAAEGAYSLEVLAFFGGWLPYLLTLSLAERLAWAWRTLPTAYVEDVGGDDWQTPARTLRRQRGDCEDWSVLLAAILIRLGIEARVGVVPRHAAVFVPLQDLSGLPFPFRNPAAIPSEWKIVRHQGQKWLILEATTLPGQRRQPGWDDGLIHNWVNTDHLWIAGTANG